MLLLVALGMGDWLNKTKKYYAYIFYTLAVFSAVAIAFTYSRSGMLAVFAALLAYYFTVKKKSACLFIALLLLLSLAVVPKGGNRLASIANIGEASIANRLHLWKGAAGMIHLRPFGGWQRGRSTGKLYEQWYMPDEINERYWTMINDSLTIATRYGLPILFFLLMLVLGICWFGLSRAKATKSPVLAGLSCAVLSYFVASNFSTLYIFKDVFIYFLTCFLALVLVLGTVLKTKDIFTWQMLVPICLSLAICGGIWCIGFFVNDMMNIANIEYLPSNDITGEYLRATSKEPGAVIVCLIDKDSWESPLEYSHPKLSLFLQQGFSVYCAKFDTGNDELENVQAFIDLVANQNDGIDLFLLAVGKNANFAVLMATQQNATKGLRGFVSCNPEIYNPCPELSLSNNIDKLAIPGVIFYAEEKRAEYEEYLAQCHEKQKQMHGLTIETADDTNILRVFRTLRF